jgi:pilus assembly protein CpaB
MRRSLIALVALLAGAATFVMLQMTRAPELDAEITRPVSDAVYVLVYARDLPRGTMIDETAVTWQQQLRNAIPAGAIVGGSAAGALPDVLKKRLLRRDVLAGEVLRPDLLVEGAASFMALALSPGMRAVALAATPQRLAGGFILPEDRINLIHTVTGDFDGDGKASSFSQTILENIRVLAVGETPTSRFAFQTMTEQDASASLQSEVMMKGETITLEMSDEEAAVLFSAQASGQISLALRAIEDHGASRIVSTVGFETSEAPPKPEPVPQPLQAPVLPADTAPPEPSPVAEALAPKEPTSRTVRLIEGGTARFVDVPVVRAEGQP